MTHSRILLIALFVFSVLPTTLIAVLLAFIGLPFWVLGVIDVLMVNITISSLLNSPRFDMVLLFISAPMGVIGLLSLWGVYLRWLRKKEIMRRRKLIFGLWCGVLAGVHLLFLKFALLPLAIPSVAYALVKLRSIPNQGASPHAG